MGKIGRFFYTENSTFPPPLEFARARSARGCKMAPHSLIRTQDSLGEYAESIKLAIAIAASRVTANSQVSLQPSRLCNLLVSHPRNVDLFLMIVNTHELDLLIYLFLPV